MNGICKAVALIACLFLFLPSYCAGIHSNSKKQKNTPAIHSPYTTVKDSVWANNNWEVHNDTVFTNQDEAKRIITSYDLIPDTTWQNENVYSSGYDTVFHYDYTAKDPAYNYSGKIKMSKPFSFFFFF